MPKTRYITGKRLIGSLAEKLEVIDDRAVDLAFATEITGGDLLLSLCIAFGRESVYEFLDLCGGEKFIVPTQKTMLKKSRIAELYIEVHVDKTVTTKKELKSRLDELGIGNDEWLKFCERFKAIGVRNEFIHE